MSSQDKKRADIVGSSRSRLANDKDKTKLKVGERHQQEFVKMIEKMFSRINAQLEVEPNASSFHDLLHKKDKKKLN